MKKWILVVVLYGLGALLIYDVLHTLEWIGELLNKVYEGNSTLNRYYFVFLILLPILLVLMNYFILRIRAKNPAFTMLNAMFVTLFIVFMMLSSIVNHFLEFTSLSEVVVDWETWKMLWALYPAIFICSGVNLTSGIVISEAKTKGAYLTAEFIYLFTGLVLALMSFTMMM